MAPEKGTYDVNRFDKESKEFKPSNLSDLERKLLEIVQTYAENPASVTANANANVNVTFNINDEVHGLKKSLGLMKEDLLIDVQDEKLRNQLEQELDLVVKAGDSIATLSKEEAKDSAPMKRIDSFIKKMEDSNTRAGKIVKTIETGMDYAQNIAEYYNKIADWCGMPHVPSIFLKKK